MNTFDRRDFGRAAAALAAGASLPAPAEAQGPAPVRGGQLKVAQCSANRRTANRADGTATGQDATHHRASTRADGGAFLALGHAAAATQASEGCHYKTADRHTLNRVHVMPLFSLGTV